MTAQRLAALPYSSTRFAKIYAFNWDTLAPISLRNGINSFVALEQAKVTLIE